MNVPGCLVLHVRNLPSTVRHAHLKAIFSRFGNVLHVRIISKPSGQPSYAFVVFSTPEDVNRALEWASNYPLDINGSAIPVSVTVSSKKSFHFYVKG